MDAALDWLSGLPPAALYASLALVAALENIVPPIPADTVVAFGSFLAARGDATPVGTFLATWLGNLAGAMGVYALGRRFGLDAVARRFHSRGGRTAMVRLRRLHRRRGALALFVSRFLPGMRALVPLFAGAARMPAWKAGLLIGVASALWYGAITVVAFRAGTSWDELRAVVSSLSRDTALVVAAVFLVALAVWRVRRRRRA
jgi:membrane protein DedA with SNARE-associated domain